MHRNYYIPTTKRKSIKKHTTYTITHTHAYVAHPFIFSFKARKFFNKKKENINKTADEKLSST